MDVDQRFELKTARQEDGQPFKHLDTYHVKVDGRLIGTIQRFNDNRHRQDLWLAWSHPDRVPREGDGVMERGGLTARAACEWLLEKAGDRYKDYDVLLEGGDWIALRKKGSEEPPPWNRLVGALAAQPEVISYILRHGGMCRDCADRDGVCWTGLPCEEAEKAVKHVLVALDYGLKHGYVKTGLY